MVEVIQQMSTSMLKITESLKKVVNHILQRILILQNVQISINAETVQEFKEKILIIRATVGHSPDIKYGKLNNMDKLVEQNK